MIACLPVLHLFSIPRKTLKAKDEAQVHDQAGEGTCDEKRPYSFKMQSYLKVTRFFIKGLLEPAMTRRVCFSSD